MEQNTKKYEELIQAFHLTWDSFPGVARLIGKGDYVLAANRAAEAAGLTAGQICAKMGSPESHKGCKKALALSTQTAQVDRPVENRIRAWVPVDGYPDIVIHFSVGLPEWGQDSASL